jgi:hypothetical protein
MTTRFSSGDTFGLPLVADFAPALTTGSLCIAVAVSSTKEGMYCTIDMLLLPSLPVADERTQHPDSVSAIKAFIHSSPDTFINTLTASSDNGFPAFFNDSAFNTSIKDIVTFLSL